MIMIHNPALSTVIRDYKMYLARVDRTANNLRAPKKSTFKSESLNLQLLMEERIPLGSLGI